MSEIKVRPLLSQAEMRQVSRVQKKVWDSTDLEVIPAHMLHALAVNGSALLGAFDGDTLVGFVLGVLATVEAYDRVDQVAAARLKMYSVIAGVMPEYQSQGVGYQLKLAQREFALRVGLRLITWTYDPLESLNARFNIGKLGAVCSRYLRNFHGEMTGLNAGMTTDRFEAEWWVTSNRVEGRVVKQRQPLSLDALLGGGARLVNETTFDGPGVPIPPAVTTVNDGGNLVLAEIPADLQAIKDKDFDLALHWREHTRHLFETLFQSNYMVTDFVFHRDSGGRHRSFYLLTHKDS